MYKITSIAFCLPIYLVFLIIDIFMNRKDRITQHNFPKKKVNKNCLFKQYFIFILFFFIKKHIILFTSNT